jgi:hypothetical protein
MKNEDIHDMMADNSESNCTSNRVRFKITTSSTRSTTSTMRCNHCVGGRAGGVCVCSIIVPFLIIPFELFRRKDKSQYELGNGCGGYDLSYVWTWTYMNTWNPWSALVVIHRKKIG